MLINFNQIKFDYLDWGCFESCDSSNLVKFQALIDKVCETIDWTEVDLKCLSEKRLTNPIDILNLVTKKLCELPSKSTGLSIDISKIMLCGKDNWTETNTTECLEVLTECFPTLTLEAIIQAIIFRINNYAIVIKQLKDQLNEQGKRIFTLETQINVINSKLQNCCG